MLTEPLEDHPSGAGMRPAAAADRMPTSPRTRCRAPTPPAGRYPHPARSDQAGICPSDGKRRRLTATASAQPPTPWSRPPGWSSRASVTLG